MKLIGALAVCLTWAMVFVAAGQAMAEHSAEHVQSQLAATGSACSQAGCAYTRHRDQTLVSCDNRRDGKEFKAQGVVESGRKWTVRDGNGVNPGCGRINPHHGGKFLYIRGGYPGHYTSWRAV